MINYDKDKLAIENVIKTLYEYDSQPAADKSTMLLVALGVKVIMDLVNTVEKQNEILSIKNNSIDKI